jgi:hypothetical protein
MSLTYNTYVAQVANIMAVDSTTTQFQTMLPGMIDYAEQRIYRELDLLNTVVRNSTLALTASNRNFTLPTTTNGNFITLQGINLITPAETGDPDEGTRNALQPTTRDYLDTVWNSSTGATLPKLFAMIDQFNIIVGPWPDATYQVEVIGTIRPTPLSTTNTSTFLTQYLPDLFLAASMIFATGYQRDFGSQSDNPAQAVSWESQYEKLFASANGEEMRKKFAGPGWTSLSAIANPPVR